MVDRDMVLALKASAREARSEQAWDFAIADLEEALAILGSEVAKEGPTSTPTVSSEMADIYGMLGGIHRRWGLQLSGSARGEHLARSVAAYDRGFALERESAMPQGSTYNRINRLVSRVLLDPGLLTSTSDEGRRLIAELEVAEQLVRDQLDRGRIKDPWAYCDLLTLELLLERPTVRDTLTALTLSRPPSFVFESALNTLEPLAASVRPQSSTFDEVLSQLRRSLG